MAFSRRDMLRSSAVGAGVLAVGNVGALLTSNTALASSGGRGNDAGHSNPQDATDYGPLVSDPAGVLELPAGFSYRIVSRADTQQMPGFYDGTGAFRGPANSTGIVRNSELATSGISTVSSPPSTGKATPVTKEASPESRKATARATSSGWPTRPIACSGPSSCCITSALPCSGPRIGVSMTPGQTAFTRIR